MQYINSHLGIPVLPKFKDMMSVSGYSNASGDSVSSLQSQMRKIESDIRQLQVKKAKEDEKARKELVKIEEAQKYIKRGKFQQGNKMRNEADYAIREARTEIQRIDSQINLLNIDYNDLKSQLEAMGGAPVPAPSTPKPPVPSVPPVAGGSASAGLVPLPDDNTTPPSTDSTGSAKKTNWPLYVGLGLVGYFALAYYMGKVVKPQ